MKHLFVAARARHRIERAGRWLQGRKDAVLLGPSREALRGLLFGAGHVATFGFVSTTLARTAFALALPQLARSGRVPASRAALQAVVARVVFRKAAAGALGVLQTLADRPGLARALLRTFDDLGMAGVTDPGPELRELYAEYILELERDGLADRGIVYAAALEGAGAAAGPTLAFDVPTATVLERRLLSALIAAAPEALVLRAAEDAWVREAPATDLSREPAPDATMGDALFSDAHAPFPVRVLSAPGESRECVELMRALLAKAESGVPFDRMGILLRTPQVYRPHLEEAFRRTGVPFYLARGARRPSPAGRAFLALLSCAKEDLSASRFGEYLSVGEVPDATPEGAPPPAEVRFLPVEDEFLDETEAAPDEERAVEEPDAVPVEAGTLRTPRLWERLIVDAAVIGGSGRWERRLEGLRSSLTLSAKAADEESRERYERDLRALAGLRRFALPLLADLEALPKQATWGEWTARLAALATRSLRRPDPVLRVLAELAPMGAVGPIEIHEVYMVLEPRLQDVAVPPPRDRFGAVFVGSIEDAAGLSFDTVFVPGLAEKMFPQRITEDPLLLDAARRTIGPSLDTNETRADAERALLRLAVSAADAEVILSYPRLDVDGARPRTPSFYALEVVRAARGTLLGFDELSRAAEEGTHARLGWPAPQDPLAAIDEAEHDLSMLERLLSTKEDDSVGLARYLLSQNPHLGRALRVRAQRWSLRKWTPADGLVEPGAGGKAALLPHAITARSYSPTALQNFAACPYRFYLQAVLRLAPRQELAPIEELDPMERGSLVHEAQFRLLLRLREEGMLPLAEAAQERAFQMLEDVVREVAASYEEELVPAIERVWQDGLLGIRADLREWLRRTVRDHEYTPAFFELSFGLRDRGDARDPLSRDEDVKIPSGLRLRGSIDLVERRKDGALRATDHKTGKVRAAHGDVIKGGDVLQPVFYALVLEALMPGTKVSGGRLYYCTHQAGFEAVDMPLDQRARDAAQVVTDTVRAALDTGFLPAAPADGACTYCDYRGICGPYEELRVKKKAQTPLNPLKKLRSQA